MMSAADWVWYAVTVAVFVPAAMWVLRRRALVRWRRWWAARSYNLTVTIREDKP